MRGDPELAMAIDPQPLSGRQRRIRAIVDRMAKRDYFKSGGYSRDFTPAPQGHKRYLLDRIPVPFWREVQSKAKREGVSLRALILRLLTDWLKS